MIWKSIIIDNKITNYEVSNTGLIRNKINKKILSTSITNSKYLQVDLWINNKRIHQYIHRLVALAFIDNPNNKLEVNHIDGNKLNNNVNNLEWVTHQENNQYAYDIGLRNKGSECSYSKYNDNQIHTVCKLLMEFIPIKLINKLTNVSTDLITKIKNGYS